MPGKDPILDAMDALSGDTHQDTYNPDLTTTINKTLLHFDDNYQPNDNPQVAPLGESNPKYNVTDESHIDRDVQGALQGYFRNAWNSFKQGIDQTQIVTDQGRMIIGAGASMGPRTIIAMAPDRIKDLDDQVSKGKLSQSEADIQKAGIGAAVQDAQDQMTKLQQNIDENQVEYNNEPVSRKFALKSAMLQSQGDQGGAWDKFWYTTPNTMGSSMALMVPTLAATFGNNITKALIKTAVTELAGPEVGLPVQTIATVGAIAASLAEVGYGRHLETLGEVAQSQQQVETDLTNKYMKEHDIADKSKIPAEDARQIYLQSIKGGETQYWENMALAIPDVIGAMVMPLGNFGAGLSKAFHFADDIEEGMQAVRNYNKLSRLMYTGAELGIEATKEKFEEGFQQAAQYRAQGQDADGGEYTNKGLFRNILEDGYDTFASLNYSLLPGIDLRNSQGRYANDPNFQFSENSGGILGMIMSGIPAGIATFKDLKAYRDANKDLQNNGIVDIDGKYKRLQNSILIKYFDNDQVHHLGEAIKSLVDKNDENGQPIMTKAQSMETLNNIKEAYDAYTGVSDRVDSIGSKGFSGTIDLGVKKITFGDPQVKAAKAKLKEDYLDVITNIRAKEKEEVVLQSEANEQYLKERGLFEDGNPEALSARQELEARMESIERLKSKHDQLEKESHLAGMFKKGSWMERINDLYDQLVEESKQLGEAEDEKLDKTKFEFSPKLQEAYDKINANWMFQKEYRDKLTRLNSIKSKSDLLAYTQDNMSRPVGENSDIQKDMEDDKPPVTAESVAEKIYKGEATTPEDLQFQANNPGAVEAELKKRQAAEEPTVNNTAPEPVSPEQEQGEWNSIFTMPSKTVPEKVARAKAFESQLGQYDIVDSKGTVDPASVATHSLPTVWGALRNIHADNQDALYSHFEAFQDIYRDLDPSTAYYELNSDGTLTELNGVPPSQNDDIQVNNDNKKTVAQWASELDQANIGNMITSGLSLAQLNQLQDTVTGKNSYVAGELQFSKQHDQQLINTNLVNPGDILEVGVESIPDGFNYEDTSDANYDKVSIGAWKAMGKGSVTQDKLLAHLHTIETLPKLLPDIDRAGKTFDKEAELTLLRVNRQSIIQKHKEGVQNTQYKILTKGFGYLNMNENNVTSTIKNAIGADTRPVLTYVNENREPVGMFHATNTATKGNLPPGAVVLLIPNETNNGTMYVPLMLKKQPFKSEVDKDGEPVGIYKKVYDSLIKFLETGDWKDKGDAAPYVYMSTNDALKGKMGVKGIYAAKRDGKIEVWANDRPFSPENHDGLKEAIGETYLSINKHNVKDQAYQDELMRSSLLQTNLVANPELINNELLEGDNKYSYFSQHTITVGVDEEVVSQPETTANVHESDEDIMRAFDDIDVDNKAPTIEGKLAKYLRRTASTGVRDDISPEVRSKLLVSPEISPSLQTEMIESLAFNLRSAEKPGDDEGVEKIKNSDRIKAWVKSKVIALEAAVEKSSQIPGYPADKLERANKALTNLKLMDTHIDALLDKTRKLIDSLGVRFDEDTDYYENLEEQGETNSFNEFDDDSSRKVDSWAFAPKEVKKLLWFIPKLQELNEAFEVDREYIASEVKAGRPAPTYREMRNSMGLPTFNNVRDTWEKVLEITSSRFFDGTDAGYQKMLNMLQDKSNAPVVQELAKRLMKSAEQVQTAFFKATKLQKQNNITGLYDTRVDRGGGVKRFTTLVPANRRQGIRATFNALQNEFLNATTGILTPTEGPTGARVYHINVSFAKGIRANMLGVIDNDSSYRASTKGEKSGLVFTDVAKRQLLQLVNQAGINLSSGGFDDMLKNYQTEAGAKTDKLIFRELIINRIMRRLAGEFASKIEAADDENADDDVQTELKLNNPFKEERKSMNAIAAYEHSHRTNTQAGAYRTDSGESYFSYVKPNYISDIFLKIREFKETGNDQFIRALRDNTSFAKGSIYLNMLLDPRVDTGLELFYELGSRNMTSGEESKLLKEMNPREHQVTKLAWYQNKGNWKAYYLYDTLSDKSTKPVPTALKFDVAGLSYDGPSHIRLPHEALDRVYTAHFLGEYRRIKDVEDQNKNLPAHMHVKGYHGDRGMGKYFNIMYFLNKAHLQADGAKLAYDMYNEDGSLKYNADGIPSAIKSAVIELINAHINKLIQTSKEDMRQLGIYDLDAMATNKFTKQEEPSPFMIDLVEHNYMFGNMNKKQNSVVAKLGIENVPGIREANYKGDWRGVPREVLERIVDYTVADYVYNYMVHSNEMLLLTGDPAQAGKLADRDTIASIRTRFENKPAEMAKQLLEANVKSTLVNLNKRNASFLASGEGGKFKDTNYVLSVANDVKTNSDHLAYYSKLFGEDVAKDAYGDKELTDAQEMTTVKEFLTVLQAYGKIDEIKYTKALHELDREQYNEDLAAGLIKDIRPNSTEREELRRLVAPSTPLQPQKPVQRTSNIEQDMKMAKQFYVKTSAYPLIPDMLAGSMKEFLNDMKKNKVARVSFATGVKQGNAGSKDIFNPDGSYNKSFFENNQNTLNRDGFRIQLEVPFDENHDHIREGTQQSKIIFVDISDDTPLTYRGVQVSAGELKDKYVDLHRKILDIQKAATMEDLGVTEIRGVMNRNLRKMSNMLIREGVKSNFSMDTLFNLDLNTDGNFKVPLTFLPNVGQIEPLLTAVMSNNMTRMKMPGGSGIQGSEAILKTGLKGKVEVGDEEKIKELKDKRSIIWTKPEYANLEKLGFLHKDADGNVVNAQIVMPFYFNKDGKRLDVRSYMQEGTNLIDMSKIDPELLQLNGFRIPYQGRNSGLWFEIVGFLPMQSGDLVVVPGEIAGQMGSDYDVDKLYQYMYNYQFTKPGTKLSAEVYQGRKSEKDARDYNYYTTSEEEAKGYGEVHKELINLSNVLEKIHNTPEGLKWNKEYEDLHDEFRAKEGHGFDILDNSPEGLVKQNKFFDFLKAKGYDGLSLISEGGNIRTPDVQDEDKYIVAFANPNKRYDIQKVDSDNPTTKKELQNALIDIQKSIYTASDKNIHESILKPLSFDDIKASVKYLGIDARREFLGNFDPLYQRDVYFSNSTGKLGTAISAVANTSHALSQGANLYVKGQGILFLDEKGVPYDDFMEGDQNLITGSDANKIQKKEQFDRILSTYRSNLHGRSIEYYEKEIEAIRAIYDKHTWSNDTRESELFTKFGQALAEAEDMSDDPEETAKELQTLVGDFVHLLKYNSPEDNELMSSRIALNNDNAVNRTYSDTYTYSTKEKDVNQNAPGNAAWRLDKVDTFPDPVTGQSYKISDLISQMLGVSVDNAKEQVLGALGVNEVNFNTALLILRSGFSTNYMGAFINQEILKEYYNKVGEADDIYKVDYTPNKKQAAIDGLFEKYSKMYGIKENVQTGPSFEGFKLSDMKEWLDTGITAKNAREQLYILKAFIRYKDIADNLQTLNTNFNIDAKGLPKNMSETAAKADVIGRTLAGDMVFPTVNQSIPFIGNIQKYRDTTIPGLYVDVPRLAQRIFMGETNPIFAYNTQAYRKNLSSILTKVGRPSLKQKDIDRINNHTKQFIYSGLSNMSPTQLTDLRARLLFDSANNESVQTRLINLKDRLPHDEFLQAIREVGSIFPDNPKLVEIPTGSDEDYVQKTKELWLQAIYNQDPDLSTFAKDLVRYAVYVSPQEYGQNNIMKYVPGQYLDTIGWAEHLHGINNRLSDEDATIYFADQFIQHNPDLASTARVDDKGGVQLPGTIVRGQGNIINSFTLPSINTEAKDNTAQGLVRVNDAGGKYYPEYLSVYNNKDAGKQLYAGQANVDGSVSYFRVEKLGISGMTEYSFNGSVNTLIATQSINFQTPVEDSSTIINMMGPSDLFEGEHVEEGDYLNAKNNSDQILGGIVRTDNDILINPGSTKLNKQYAKLYQWLAKQYQFMGLDKVGISMDENHPTAGTYDPRTNSIVFNPVKMATNRSTGLSAELEKQRVILHEMTHPLLTKALRERRNTPEYKALVDVWNAYKDNIYKGKDTTNGIPTDVFNAELFRLLKQRFDQRDKNAEISNADFMRYTSHILNNEDKFDALMADLGTNLAKLHEEGKIGAANFDISKKNTDGTKERFNSFRAHIVNDFMSNIATMKNKYYGYYDMEEFVPETLTNKETQDFLKTMPSIWSRVVTAVKNFLASIFGTDSEERTLLDDSFDAVFNFLKPEDKGVSSQEEEAVGPVKDDVEAQIDKLIEDGFIKIKCK